MIFQNGLAKNMTNKTPAQKIINFLDTNYRLFEVFWGQTYPDDREEIIEEIAKIIDKHIEYNWR